MSTKKPEKPRARKRAKLARPPHSQKRSAGEWYATFLTAMAGNGNVRASCAAAGITRTVAYQHREKNPEFAAAWDDSLEDAHDLLEGVAVERAREKSDDLLKFLLRSYRPTRFGDARKLTLEGGAPIQLQTDLTAEQRQLAIERLHAELTRRLSGNATAEPG